MHFFLQTAVLFSPTIKSNGAVLLLVLIFYNLKPLHFSYACASNQSLFSPTIKSNGAVLLLVLIFYNLNPLHFSYACASNQSADALVITLFN